MQKYSQIDAEKKNCHCCRCRRRHRHRHHLTVSSLFCCDVVSVDGGWSQWGEWSECSTTCDLGVKTRRRTCTDPVPQQNGQPCNGSDEDTAQCILSYCPGIHQFEFILIALR